MVLRQACLVQAATVAGGGAEFDSRRGQFVGFPHHGGGMGGQVLNLWCALDDRRQGVADQQLAVSSDVRDQTAVELGAGEIQSDVLTHRRAVRQVKGDSDERAGPAQRCCAGQRDVELTSADGETRLCPGGSDRSVRGNACGADELGVVLHNQVNRGHALFTQIRHADGDLNVHARITDHLRQAYHDVRRGEHKVLTDRRSVAVLIRDRHAAVVLRGRRQGMNRNRSGSAVVIEIHGGAVVCVAPVLDDRAGWLIRTKNDVRRMRGDTLHRWALCEHRRLSVGDDGEAAVVRGCRR